MGALAAFDNILPAFMGTPWLAWMQWAYAAWQLLRRNALAILIVSLPFHWLLKRRRTIVLISKNRGYNRGSYELQRHECMYEIMEQAKQPGGGHLDELKIFNFFEEWAHVQYKDMFYIVHQNALFAYLAIKRKITGEVVFATDRQDVGGDIVVARRISYEEGIDMILLRKGQCRSAPGRTVLTVLESQDISSKFWGVLSLLPLYLQIHNNNRAANLLSIVVILLDMSRTWLHKIYLTISSQVIKWVKLHMLQHRSPLYTFLAVFSSKWNFSDPTKKRAYYIYPGESILVKDYCKFKDKNDLGFDEENPIYLVSEKDEYNGCFEIDTKQALYVWRNYDNRYLRLISHIKLYVP